MEISKETKIMVEKQTYYGRDCTTYGICPSCGKSVYNGIIGTQNKCPKCGQLLKWK